jgi:hypothetical protein
MSEKRRKIHWYLWPFYAIWKLVSGIVEFTGRVVAIVLGFVLIVVGILLTFLVVTSFVGIPMIIIGFLLVIRGFF